MNKYDFTLVLSESMDLTDDIANALFAAGCDDGTPGTSNGVFAIDFHREANSLEEAMRSAIANVGSAGFAVARVELEPEAVAQSV